MRVYDLDYRRQVEGDIADAAGTFVASHAKDDEPFFLYVGWSHVHYPSGASEEFMGRSAAGAYGDMLMEHDHAWERCSTPSMPLASATTHLSSTSQTMARSPTKARMMTTSAALPDPFVVK